MERGQILKIPNLISLFRIIVIIPYIILFLRDHYLLAGLVLVISGISDLLDGMVARKFNQVTELGKIIDPIADKLTLLAVLICLGMKFSEIIPLVVIFFLKEITMLIGGGFLINKRIAPIAAKWYGKIATVIFYISAVTIICLKAICKVSSPEINIILLSITAFFMIFALYKYSILFFTIVNDEKSKK
ncbi:MAG: CDP-alcohol phosphatidyltransferase family protein [Clostridia bacterium]|nr:CDP-alcohol phosphatidyltransferase family protein [Clostridia bacterium]